MEGGPSLSLGLSSIGGTYSTMVEAIIRPPRMHYTTADLGPPKFRLGRRTFQRTDFEVVNKRGLTIQASHYEPVAGERPRKQLPCVIYLHGNCGCRLDALEWEYVSLGYYEKEDLVAAVEHLRSTGTVSRIGLWGRSMGAATSIMYGATDPSIACMVLDSPFSSLTKVAKELVENSPVKIPKMMVSIGLRMIRKTIVSKAKFDINKLEPIAVVGSCFIPALFVHGESDTFIGSHHSHELIFFHNALLSAEEQEETMKVAEALEGTSSGGDSYRSPRVVPDVSADYDPSMEDMEDEMLRQALLLSLQDCTSPYEISPDEEEKNSAAEDESARA
ncbi:abnormal long morphology protein [Acanthamoeba castellanii str. Neff]|uniref:Abnormal long morphology protein n=1 Tax=Acanthamoeba castellanii (strain ATCC 30010 / Neff) TaxID=1257118 RepID=L8H4K0_ACACF|nr:abnormal long morphology protein [Acanthamoeba castellanii str. Neff]ELR20464.1 abnormal long morphology protein [Acanthamoeba castellanii str. Neff]